MLQADFANMHLGGGVLHGGNVQEEIRFGIASPELLVGMLIAHEPMADNEAIVLQGTELVSRYKGYGGGVEWDRPYGDKTPRKDDGTIDNLVIAIDALMYPNGQFERDCIDRDLCKAYVGFSYPYPDSHPLAGLDKKDVATGKWGCGVFGGDIEMKFLQQWIAVSAGQPGRKMVFATFHDRNGVPKKLHNIIKLCQEGSGEKPVPIKTVKQLYDKMIEYAKQRSTRERKFQQKLFDYDRHTQSVMKSYRAKCDAAQEAGQEPPAKPELPPRPQLAPFDFELFLSGGSSSDQCLIC